MPPDASPEATSARRRWLGPLLSLAGIGGLTLAGWLAVRWLSPTDPSVAPIASAPGSSGGVSVPGKPPPPRPIALVPENPAIAGMREEALGVLSELEKRFPYDPAVLCSVGSLYALYALDDEAERRWQRSIRLAPKSAAPYNAMGCAALVRGDYPEAIRHLRKAIELDRSLPRAQLMLGEALIHAAQMEQAVAELKQFTARNPKSAEGFFQLGQAYFHLRDYENAQAAQQRAVQLSPKMAAAYHTLARVCEALGQHQQAEAYRQEFVQRNPARHEPGTTQRGGVNDMDLGRWNLAEAHLAAARTYLAAARAKPDSDCAQEAERHLVAAARADPTNRESRIALLTVYDQSRRYREAAQVVGELAEIDPQDATHRLSRGILLVRLGEAAAAEKEFRSAIDVAPEEADGYEKLARLLLLNKTRLREARELMQSAIRLQPKEASHHQLLSQICQEQGDRPAATAALQRAIELDPTNPRLQQHKAKLDVQREP